MSRSYMFTREQVLDAAIELTQEKGFYAVSARSLGDRLGATSRPIFSHFKNMAEVQMGIINEANMPYQDFRKKNKKRKIRSVQGERDDIYPFCKRGKRVF